MSHFLLYIPDSRIDRMSVEGTFTSLGLRDLYAESEQRQTETGPDGGTGMLCAWRRPGADPSFHYATDKQTWFKAAKSGELEAGRYWVGIWNERPPTPADLQRPYPLPGKRVTLGDGNDWLLPSLPELPRDAIMQDDGSIRYEVQRRHYELWLEKETWAGVVRKNETFVEQELLLWLAKCLGLNYRMPVELAFNRLPPSDQSLFGRHNMIECLVPIVLGMTLKECADEQ